MLSQFHTSNIMTHFKIAKNVGNYGCKMLHQVLKRGPNIVKSPNLVTLTLSSSSFLRFNFEQSLSRKNQFPITL